MQFANVERWKDAHVMWQGQFVVVVGLDIGDRERSKETVRILRGCWNGQSIR